MRLTVTKQVLWWGGAGVVLLVALWWLGNTITPFLLGMGIAYVLNPVVNHLVRMGLSRTIAVTLITLLAVLVFAAGLVLLVPALIGQATQLVQAAPDYYETLQGFVSDRYPYLLPADGTISEMGAEAAQQVSDVAGKALPALLDSVSVVVGMVVVVLIAPVVAFYLLLDWEKMVDGIDALLPREHADTIRRLAGQIDHALAGFLRGQGLVTLILGTFYAVALVAVGLRYGLVVGIMAAIFSIIPYAGVFVGGVIAIGLALFQFWGEPLWIGAVAGIFAVGQLVEGNVLQPRIVGGSVGLHPVWLLLALAVFGALFGFSGLVLAVPLAASLGVLARFAAGRYRESALYTGHMAPPPPEVPHLVEIAPPGTAARMRAAAASEQGQAVTEVKIEEARREAVRAADEAAHRDHAAFATATVPVRAPGVEAQLADAVEPKVETFGGRSGQFGVTSKDDDEV